MSNNTSTKRRRASTTAGKPDSKRQKIHDNKTQEPGNTKQVGPKKSKKSKKSESKKNDLAAPTSLLDEYGPEQQGLEATPLLNVDTGMPDAPSSSESSSSGGSSTSESDSELEEDKPEAVRLKKALEKAAAKTAAAEALKKAQAEDTETKTLQETADKANKALKERKQKIAQAKKANKPKKSGKPQDQFYKTTPMKEVLQGKKVLILSRSSKDTDAQLTEEEADAVATEQKIPHTKVNSLGAGWAIFVKDGFDIKDWKRRDITVNIEGKGQNQYSIDLPKMDHDKAYVLRKVGVKNNAEDIANELIKLGATDFQIYMMVLKNGEDTCETDTFSVIFDENTEKIPKTISFPGSEDAGGRTWNVRLTAEGGDCVACKDKGNHSKKGKVNKGKCNKFAKQGEVKGGVWMNWILE